MTPAVRPVTAPTCAAESQPPATSVGALSALKPPRMRGFRMTMYAMVKNVTRPPRNSRASVEPRCVMWKKRSRREVEAGGLGERGAGREVRGVGAECSSWEESRMVMVSRRA
jgi:hypothetical protein